jgi:release factor glutamine methyltransferase
MAMLTEIKQLYKQSLAHIYSIEEIDEFLRLIANDFFGISFSNYKSFGLKPLISEHEALYKSLLPQFIIGKPYQYILGYEYFCGLKIKVNNAVLIPRPETEELVNMAVVCINKSGLKTIVDFGTGSGCIAIAIKNLCSHVNVMGVDLSAHALHVANENNSLVNNKVIFELYDVLNDMPEFNEKVDMIISNPPYIPIKEKEGMHINVVAHEPELALFTPNENANIFYEKLAALGTKILNKNGFIFFEIHYLGGEAVVNILQKYKYKNIEVSKSIFGQDRFVTAQIDN